MRQLKTIITVALVFTMALGFLSCEDENGENEKKVSAYNDDDSHNEGQNCMECHKINGEGEGVFTLAGTVYNEAMSSTVKNPTIMLYTGTNETGNMEYGLEGDVKGNFYTTETIDFGTSLYVSVEGPTEVKQMISSITTGQCNSCHGVSTNKIWVK